jgi:hypothetical protein
MAWNPHPHVQVARDAAAKLGADQIVIVHINNATGQIGLATYGKTMSLCSDAKQLGEAAYNAIYETIAAEDAT